MQVLYPTLEENVFTDEEGMLVCPICFESDDIKIDVSQIENATIYADCWGDADDERSHGYDGRVGTSSYTCNDCGYIWLYEEPEIVIERRQAEVIAPLVALWKKLVDVDQDRGIFTSDDSLFQVWLAAGHLLDNARLIEKCELPEEE